MIILYDPPATPPSMNANSLALAIRYNRGHKVTHALDDNNHVVKDVFGTSVECSGTWNAPHYVAQFLAAVFDSRRSGNRRYCSVLRAMPCLQRTRLRGHVSCMFIADGHLFGDEETLRSL